MLSLSLSPFSLFTLPCTFSSIDMKLLPKNMAFFVVVWYSPWLCTKNGLTENSQVLRNFRKNYSNLENHQTPGGGLKDIYTSYLIVRWINMGKRARAHGKYVLGFYRLYKKYNTVEEERISNAHVGQHILERSRPRLFPSPSTHGAPKERILSPNVNLLEACLPSNFRAFTRPLTRSYVNTTKRRNQRALPISPTLPSISIYIHVCIEIYIQVTRVMCSRWWEFGPPYKFS